MSLLLLACAPELDVLTSADGRRSIDGGALDRRGPDVEICDTVDNDLDGDTDEDCTSCDRFVTRGRAWWGAHSCVIDGDATGTSLVQDGATLGDVVTAEELAASLTAPKRIARDRLEQELITARLNMAAFDLAAIPYVDIDADGVVDTVADLVSAGEEAWRSGSGRTQGRFADRLRDLNGAGESLDSWFDEDCVTEPEICNGLDDDLDGSLDEACACHEVCDGVDNDADGEADEGCHVACDPLAPDVWTMGEALALGLVDITSDTSARVVVTNLGDIPVLLDEQLVLTSDATQSMIPDEVTTTVELDAGESLELRYAPHTTDNGEYSPYLGEYGWWCIEYDQPTMAGASFDLYGETAPATLRSILNEETDFDGDGVEDHVDWEGRLGVETAYSVWDLQEDEAVLTVGKQASASGEEVTVSLIMRNLGAIAGTGTMTDTVPAGWSLARFDTDGTRGVDDEGRHTVSWTLTLDGFDAESSASVRYAAAARSYSIVRDSGADSPQVELGRASVVVDGVESSSVAAWVFDYDPNGDGIVECDE